MTTWTTNEAEIAEEASFIERQQIWPLWPLLPVKNMNRGDADYPRDETHGIMVGSLDLDVKPHVYLKNLYDFQPGVSIGEQLQGVRVLEFDSIEELVRAGWIGD